ncbi:MAG TPA: PAS domain S-box protein [Methanoregulaceae archaeon]|nr:PAS domain S-box protein [Methanoregulaceae archaeon]
MAQDSGIVAPELLAGVRALLKNNPKGMSVSDIAAGLGMNRNSAAKYLDILSVGGQIEMRAFGPAKVYFLSQRAPLGAILNYTAEYILIIDQHSRILQVNDRFLEFLGMDRADLLGASIDAVHLPIISAPEVRSRMLEARSEGEVSLELERGEGETARYYRVRLVSTAFDDGSTGITCIVEEITARKQAERDLVERERRFREIVELSPFPCAIVDAGGVYHYVNSRFSETFGYTAEEIGTIDRWFELAYPDPDYRSAMAVEWDREAASWTAPEPRIFHLRTRSGEVREVVCRRRRLSDGNHYLVYEDISELRRLETVLAERNRIDDALYLSLRRLREISEAGHNILFGTGSDGRITYASPLFERIAGRRAAAFVGMPIDQLFTGSGLDLGPAFLAGIAAGRSPEEQELVLRRDDGTETTLIASLVPSRNAAGDVTGLEAHLLLRSDRNG